MMVFFRTRLAKILIWQNFLKRKNPTLINAKQMFCYWLFLNNSIYMENSLRFETSFRSNWPNWNLHRSEFHYARSHVNANNEVTLHQSEILPWSEILNRFEFTSGLM